MSTTITQVLATWRSALETWTPGLTDGVMGACPVCSASAIPIAAGLTELDAHYVRHVLVEVAHDSIWTSTSWQIGPINATVPFDRVDGAWRRALAELCNELHAQTARIRKIVDVTVSPRVNAFVEAELSRLGRQLTEES